MKSFLDRAKNQWSCRTYEAFRFLGRLVNDLSPKHPVPDDLIASLRRERRQHEHKIFRWALHEADGRNQFFESSVGNPWPHWLFLLRYGHFRWNAPDDPLISDIWNSIRALGRSTWSRLFERYIIPELDFHDWYSVPDVYYMTKTFGRLPARVLDIGGGWGRLGVAWHAVGVPTVCITDAIEQAYAIQYQYLASIPNGNFVESLSSDSFHFPEERARGIFHFPMWDLTKIPDQCMDVVSAVQVLREVGKECIEFLLPEIKRILVKGGIFYVRENDHEYLEQCMHDVKITERFADMGFEVILFDLIQGKDIHGVPRIFRSH